MAQQKIVVSDFKGRGVIRTLKGSKNYYMRFGFHDQTGWTPWRKTGTSDFQEASKIASDEYQRLRGRLSSTHGKMDVSKIYDDFTFIGAARRWLEMYRRKAEAGQPASGRGKPASLIQHKTYQELVDRYMAPFFNNRSLDRFKDQDIIDYVNWRRSYFTTGPGSQMDTIETVRYGKPYRHKVKHEAVELRSGELSTIRAIFQFASKDGLITAKQIPDIPKSSKNIRDIKKSRHPAFSKEHWKIVEDKIDAYTRTPNEDDRKARIGFKYFMLIMAETGLRSGKEHTGIKWRHLVPLPASSKTSRKHVISFFYYIRIG